MSDPQAILVQVADGMTAELAAAHDSGKFAGLVFTPERSYADWKDDELEDLDCLHVDVVPVGHDSSDQEDRGAVGYVCTSDIGIRKKFGPRSNAQSGRIRRTEIDRLVLLVEEIHEHFCMERLPTFESAIWRETKIRTTFSRRHLRDMRMFLGVIRVSYDVSQAL